MVQCRSQGRTFAKIIADFVERYGPLQETYLPLYETPKGRQVYEETLACVQKQFPQYVREVEGTADGSGVPFYKVTISAHNGTKKIRSKNHFPRVRLWCNQLRVNHSVA